MKFLFTTLLCLIVFACGKEQNFGEEQTNGSTKSNSKQRERKNLSLNDQIRFSGLYVESYSNGDAITVCFKNLSGKVIKAFRYTIVVYDDFGEPTSEINLEVTSNTRLCTVNGVKKHFVFQKDATIHHWNSFSTYGALELSVVNDDEYFKTKSRKSYQTPEACSKKLTCTITAIVFADGQLLSKEE